MDDGLAILLLVGLAWMWWDGRGVAEHAIRAVKNHCDQIGVIFINDTVEWQKVRFERNYNGRIQLKRTYSFEFVSDMERRYRGEVIMLGNRVKKIELDAYRIV